MMEFAKTKHRNGIIRLWNEAFGDSPEEISTIVSHIMEHIVVYEKDGQVAGMLTLLPISYRKKQGFYIYAVATLKAFRGLGISTELLEFAKKQNADFLVLVPQTESLFEFYKKRGFNEVGCITKSFETPEKNLQISKEAISANVYFDLRRKYCDKPLIEWNSDMLYTAKELYGGEFLKISISGKECGIAFLYMYDGTLHIKELLAEENSKEIARALGYEYGAKQIICIASGNDRFAMVYPEFKEHLYFNIALD